MAIKEATEVIEEVDREQLRANIDAQARKRLGMSGEDFLHRLYEDNLQGLDHSVVMRLKFAARML